MGEDDRVVDVGGDAREATVHGLAPSTWYIILVAAVNNAGIGPATAMVYKTEGR